MESQKDSEFKEYYIKYYPQVYGYILKKVINKAIAEDMTMDVFCSCWEKFDLFDDSKARFQTWLFVIVNNKLKNYYRDRKDVTELDDSFASDSDEADDVITAIQLQYLRDHLYVAMEELNETQREIVVCKYFKNLNSNQIAFQIGLLPGNVRIQLKRALDKIRTYFNKNNIRWE